MNKENKLLLQSLHHAYMKHNHPNMPDFAIPQAKYKDDSANALTKCIIDFLKFNGCQAERINTMGKRVDNTKVVDTVIGKRQIGSVGWIKGTGTKGSADISAVVPLNIRGVKVGVSFKIEVKYGKDRQSEYQKEYQKQIESTGGVYMIAKDFDSWLDEFNTIVKTLK